MFIWHRDYNLSLLETKTTDIFVISTYNLTNTENQYQRSRSVAVAIHYNLEGLGKIWRGVRDILECS